MRKSIVSFVAVALLVGAGLTAAAEDGDVPEEAHFGICTAREHAEEGNDASDGTVYDTPPFNSTSEEDCENATHPGNDSIPDDPGQDPPDEGQDPPEDGDTQQASVRVPVALP